MNPMLRDELVAILQETLPAAPAPAAQFPPVDVSRRAIMMRRILWIADAHGWHSAITHYLETRGTSYLSDLTEPQLEDLLDRMEGYLDAAEVGASLEHCLPAT